MGTAMNADEAVRDFWANRPRRAVEDRKLAGVAAGIAHRYRIDPTLVRVAFAVLTFYGGAGVLLYLLGWVLLPVEDGSASGFEGMTGRGRSSTSAALTVLLCLLMIPVTGWVFEGISGLVALVLGLGALYLLHRNRAPHPGDAATGPAPSGGPSESTGWTAAGPGGPAAGTSAMASSAGGTTASTGATPQDVVPESASGVGPGTTGGSTAATGAPAAGGTPGAEAADGPVDGDPMARLYGRSAPPEWDPLGAAPFAWDLPEPAPAQAPPPPPVRRGNRRITPMFLGIAVIVGGVSILNRGFSSWFNAAHTVGLVLAVLGAGLLVGSLVRGGRGLFIPAIPLGMAALALTTIGALGPNLPRDFAGGVGDQTYVPNLALNVEPSYHVGAGTLTLDLTKLPPDSPPVTTSVSVGVGNARIIVPPNATVDAHCQAGVGDVDCLGQQAHGHSSGIDVHNAPTAPGQTITLKLNARAGSGNVEVTRG